MRSPLRADAVTHAREHLISQTNAARPIIEVPLLFITVRAPIGSAIAQSPNALERLPPVPEEESTKQKPEY